MALKLQELFIFSIFILIVLIWKINGKPVPKLVVVAKDGTGDFKSISSAILAAPNYSKSSHYIKIKAGIYNENIMIEAQKTNLVLIGDGTDRTIITGARSNVSGYRTYQSATVAIKSEGFVAQHITVENTAGPTMGQAVSVLTDVDHVAFYKCRFLGYQDTLYTKSGKQFFRECEVEGTVDFIFGDAAVVFQNCIIKPRTPIIGQKNTITAQGREDPNSPTGTVFQNCTITATQELSRHQSLYPTYLGRPWRRFSRTVIMQSQIDSVVVPEGWLGWSVPVDNVYYAEYQNTGVGAYGRGRVKWSRNISDHREAASFTVRSFISGDAWIPANIPHYLDFL